MSIALWGSADASTPGSGFGWMNGGVCVSAAGVSGRGDQCRRLIITASVGRLYVHR